MYENFGVVGLRVLEWYDESSGVVQLRVMESVRVQWYNRELSFLKYH